MKEKVKKGDLVVWNSDAGVDLVPGPFDEGPEQIGVVVEVVSLKNVAEGNIPGVRIKWHGYSESFWTPVSMVKVLSDTK